MNKNTEKNIEKNKRLAKALRENLKKRKIAKHTSKEHINDSVDLKKETEIS